METPAYAALIGFPLAWTPGTPGQISADAMYAPIHSKEDFAKWHGKLKGKIVLMFDPPHLLLHTTIDAQKSPTDEEILARGNGRGGAGGGRPAAPAAGAPATPGAPATAPRGRGRYDEGTWEYTPTSLALADDKNHDLRNEINAYLHDEAPAVVLTPGYNGDGGTIFSSYGGSQDPKDPVPPPIVAVTHRSSTTASCACCSTAPRPS